MPMVQTRTPRDRFRTLTATPPCGYYEYASQGEIVTDRSRYGICQKVRDLRTRQGLPVVGEGFSYVMEYMCPSQPDGFCIKPSTVKALRAVDVKAKTMQMFNTRCAPADEIERRMEVCVTCPKHSVRGFCLDCTGLLEWIYRGYGGRRSPLPADRATGVCTVEEVLAAALATTAERPLEANVVYPDNCWRKNGVTPRG